VNHADVQSRMADYLEGGLRLSERALFDAHLDACEACARDVRELRAVVSLLRSLPDPEPPADLAQSVMRRVAAGEGRTTWLDRIRSAASRATDLRMAVPLGVAAAAALALVVAEGPIQPLAPTPEMAVARGLVRAPEMRASGDAQPREPERLRSEPSGIRTARVTVSEPQPERPRAEVPLPPEMPPSLTLRPFAPPTGDGLGLIGASVPPPEPRVVTVTGESGAQIGEAGFVRTAEPEAAVGDNDPASKRERVHRELDRRLELLVRSPGVFARELRTASLAEQELWLKQLAGRALERDIGGQAVAALRESGDLDALHVAELLAQELERARQNTVAAEAE
jgi:hypothetical protein